MKRIVVVAGLLAACTQPPAPVVDRPPAGTVVLTERQRDAAGIAVDTSRLEPVALPLRVPASVVTADTRTAHVGAIVEGRIDEVTVLPGDRVEAGDPLVHIHSHEVATAQRDLAAAVAQARVARSAFDRSTKLLAEEAVSKEEVERREALWQEAEAELARAKEILAHLSPDADGDAVIRSPRTGTVFDVRVRPGEAVVVGAPLVTLGDATRLWATGFVPENAALGLKPGDGVLVHFDATPGTEARGRVVRVGGIVDSLRRAVEVRVELLTAPAGIKPGMFASLLVPAADRAERVVLPADAVQRTTDGEVVFVAETATRFRPHPVKAASLPDGRMAVDGLPAGLAVVTKGAYALKSQLLAPPAGG